MAATLMPNGKQYFVNSAGAPLAGGKLYTYDAGTNNLRTTYQDAAATLPNTNPVILDARGEAAIFWDGTYKIVLRDSLDNLIWTVDGVADQNAYSKALDTALRADIASTAATNKGAGMMGFNTALVYPINTVGYTFKYGSGSVAEPTSMAFGKDAGKFFATGGTGNTGLGYESLVSKTSGIGCTAYGYRSMTASQSGSFNTAIGALTLYFDNGLGFNTAVGYGSSYNVLTGTSNVALGFESLHDNQAGSANTAIGYSTQHYGLANGGAADPNSVVAVGAFALQNNQASNIVAVGGSSLKANRGAGNTAVGDNTAISNTTGSQSTFVGSSAGANKTTGSSDTMIGFQAGLSQTTSLGFNTYIGAISGFYNTTALQNTFVGYAAGQGTNGLNGGGSNVAVGNQAMQLCGSVSACVAVGNIALRNVTTGNSNVAVGNSALVNETTGVNNTALGESAGAAQTAGFSNTTNVGNGANSIASNQVTLGNASIATLRCQVTVITALSDERDKKDINQLDVPDEFLDEVLTPAVYRWAMRDGTGRGDELQVGVIAQRLKAAQDKHSLQWLGLVDESNPARLEATPGKLLFLVCLRAQRQQALLTSLAARVGKLEGGQNV